MITTPVTVDPLGAGFEPAALSRTVEILAEGVEQELYPGGTVWASRCGIDALVHSVGHTDFSRTTEVDQDTLFDLASVTKPVATASAMLLLAQEGRIHLGQPVVDFFPDRALPHLANVTLRQLLAHTSGLPAWKDLYSDGQTRERLIDELFQIPLAAEPGSTHTYSCLGYIILSLVVEAVSGEGFDSFCRRRLFEPMGMSSTGFNPDVASGRSIAATDNCPLRKHKLVGEVHDGNAYAMGGVSGNAGLFSTARDLATFCHSITNRASPDSNLPLNEAALTKMFSNALPERMGGQTLGWFTSPNDMMPAGDFVSKAAIGHTGFTGTAVVIDPGYDLFAILLTNRVCRNDDGSGFRNLRRRLFNSIVGAIVC